MSKMKPAARTKMQAIADLISKRQREMASPAEIIAELVKEHGARYNRTREPYTLRVAGLPASCAWSRDAGLIANWSKTATLRLAMDNFA